MKIKQNRLEHKCNGELIAFNDNIVFVQKVKRDSVEEDDVSIDEFAKDLKDFCQLHEGEEITIKLSAVSKTE